MNQQIRTIIFNFSAILVLLGATLYLTRWPFIPYVFALGAAGIALVQIVTPTKQLDYRRRRLQIFNVIAGLLLIVSSSFMFMDRNEWILCLSIAAILMLYTAFVAPKD